MAALPDFHFDREEIPQVTGIFPDNYLIPPGRDIPISGQNVDGMQAFEQQVCNIMRQWQVPGCSIAMAKNGRLIYARSFGWQDLVKNQPLKPQALCRIASVSKGVTSAAILKLCQDGKLSPATRALPLLNYPPVPGRRYDPRLKEITIQELLEFSGGWNREINSDPMFVPGIGLATEMLSPTLRPNPDVAIRYGLMQPLDFPPGTDFAYSNLGYAILGRVIARVTGKSYEEYARSSVLKPMEITGMRLGRTLVAAADEMTYYPFPGQETARSVFPNYTRPVPLPYGGDFGLEANEADSGWIASAPELAKFMCSLFGDRGSSILQPQWLKQMIAKPKIAKWRQSPIYFAEGFEIEETGGDAGTIVSRRGSLAGAMSYMGRTSDGTTVAYVVNSRPMDSEEFEHELVRLVWMSARLALPDKGGDQFGNFH